MAVAVGLRRGDWVEVRSEHEILATLDASASLDGLPFMEEMRRFEGRRFRVAARADGFCVEGTSTLRGVADAVFLEGLRCDGEAHGGCRRACLMVWKEAWLRPLGAMDMLALTESDVTGSEALGESRANIEDQEVGNGCSAAAAPSNFRPPVSATDGIFVCQSTELLRATVPRPRRGLRGRVRQLRAGEITSEEFIRAIGSALADRALDRILKLVRAAGGLLSTSETGRYDKKKSSVGLRPGDLVQVRGLAEIATTLDARRRNRGLEFCAGMAAHAGRTYRVKRRIDRIILETTGAMKKVPDTVVLDGVACEGCPRKNEFYWREAWLTRAANQVIDR